MKLRIEQGAFTRAFKNFHGITPSAEKRNLYLFRHIRRFLFPWQSFERIPTVWGAALAEGTLTRLITCALITKPAIVPADELTGNLDSRTSAEELGLIRRTSAEFRQTVVMITHNNDIARLADWIVRIEDGTIAGRGGQARSAFGMLSDEMPPGGSEGTALDKGGRRYDMAF